MLVTTVCVFVPLRSQCRWESSPLDHLPELASSSALCTSRYATGQDHSTVSRTICTKKNESHNPVSTTQLVLYGKSFVVGEFSSYCTLLVAGRPSPSCQPSSRSSQWIVTDRPSPPRLSPPRSSLPRFSWVVISRMIHHAIQGRRGSHGEYSFPQKHAALK